MTTLPLKDPFSQSAYLYARDDLLALVPCQLSPADSPTSGVAQVPDGHDWLAHPVLKLILKVNDRSYQIIPTRLERAAGGQTLLRFDVMPPPTTTYLKSGMLSSFGSKRRLRSKV